MIRIPNPQHRENPTFSAEIDGVHIPYTDKGWINGGAKMCAHKKREYDNSIYQMRGTDVIYICDECCEFWHVDMSD